MIKRTISVTLFLFLCTNLFGQPNCEVYQDSLCKRSCEISSEAASQQGSKNSQELFDKSIELCPSFAYSYYEKSVPYLKQGLLREWKDLIDEAVKLDSTYLLNRGINQVQFIRNYEAGLADLNRLYNYLGRFDIGYSNSGEYHGQLIRAICYQKTGELDKAIQIMEELINSSNYSPGLFDFFHIGIAYLENNNVEQAKIFFDKQNNQYEYAETYYYYSKVYNDTVDIKLKESMLIKSKELYEEGRVMENSYYHYIDKIFLSDIKTELEKLN